MIILRKKHLEEALKAIKIDRSKEAKAFYAVGQVQIEAKDGYADFTVCYSSDRRARLSILYEPGFEAAGFEKRIVDHKTLVASLASFDCDVIRLENDGLAVALSGVCDTSRRVLHGFGLKDGEDEALFFEVDSITEKNEVARVVMQFSDYMAVYRSVGVAMSTDGYRAILCGIWFGQDEAGTQVVAATDTHRLHFTTYNADSISKKTGFLLDSDTADLLSRSKKASSLVISVSDCRVNVLVAASFGNIMLTMPRVTGTYPNWERILLKEKTREAIIDKAAFLKALSATLVVAKEAAFRCFLKFEESTLTITAKADELGTVEKNLDCAITGEPITIAFNTAYLIDAANSIQDSSLKIQMTEPTRPARILPTIGQGDITIMPMSLQQ